MMVGRFRLERQARHERDRVGERRERELAHDRVAMPGPTGQHGEGLVDVRRCELEQPGA